MHPFPFPMNSSSYYFHFKPPKVYPLKRTFSAMIQPTLKLYPPPMSQNGNLLDPSFISAPKLRKKVKKDTLLNGKHISLTNEEGQSLIEKWKKGSFAAFYQWVQNAKADLKIEFKETESLSKSKNPIFQCNVHLSFPQKAHLSMLSSSEQGPSKKEAKMKTFEKIVESLLKSGLISQGLKDKMFLKENQQKNSENQKPDPIDLNNNVKKPENFIGQIPKEEEILRPPGLLPVLGEPMRNPRKQVNKLVIQMKEKLIKDKFFEGCAILCKIIDLKHPEWKEINYIWSYALLKHNLNYVQVILDLLLHKSRLKFYLNYQDQQNNKKQLTKAQEDHQHLENVKEEFLKKYGNLRLQSDNPFETVEYLDIQQQDPEINSFQTNNTPNNANMNNTNGMFSQRIPALKANLTQNNIIKPNINIMNNMNNNNNINNMNNTTNLNTPSFSQEMASSRTQIQASNNNNISMQMDLQNSRERKNAEFRYFSYKIMDSLYELLCYIPDLNFVLSVSELIYNKVRIDDEEMVNSNAASYYANKKNMLVVELLETISHSFSKHSMSPFEQLNNLTGQIQPISNRLSEEIILFAPIDPKDVLESRITRKTSAEYRDSSFQIAKGEFVLIYGGFVMNNLSQLIQGKNPIMMIGKVWEISKDYKLRIYCLPSEVQRNIILQKNQLWRVMKLVNGTSIDKTSEALREVCRKINMSPSLLQIILAPPLNSNRLFIKQLAEGSAGTSLTNSQNNVLTYKSHLNHAQNLAVKSANSQVLTLIHGPPGTGKTKTAIEIALEWLSHSPNTPILVCADSNIAVDLLHNEFMKLGVKSKRIGSMSEHSGEDKSKHFIEKTDMSSKSKEALEQLQAFKYFSIYKKNIQEAQVVCATCVGSKSDCLKNLRFPRVIIDEATQATETACLIPLIRDCQQLVLIGDHKQLAPVVISMYAQTKGLKISMFERLVRQGVIPILLNVQYRMHPTLAVFSSYHFYNNLLENGVGDEQRKPIGGFTWPNQIIRIAFIHAKGVEQIHATSIQNIIEVDIVVHVLLQVLRFKAVKPSEIGIITPYDAQKRRIKNEIINQARKFPTIFGLNVEQGFKVNKSFNLVDVDTVDGFQGMERELIIFSAVRSNNQGNLGFLKDSRRLNVMLTRAKRGLIVIGDIETLKNDAHWNDFIAWADANKIIIFYNKRR